MLVHAMAVRLIPTVPSFHLKQETFLLFSFNFPPFFLDFLFLVEHDFSLGGFSFYKFNLNQF